jgi:hypothetical protein
VIASFPIGRKQMQNFRGRTSNRRNTRYWKSKKSLGMSSTGFGKRKYSERAGTTGKEEKLYKH